MKKKATTSGANVAIIIGIIAVALIMYILFLPETERRELLDLDEVSDEDLPADLLLQEHIGKITYAGKDTINHYIPSLHIFESKDSTILGRYNPFLIKNGWFTKRSQTVSFSLDNFDYTENVMLAFDAPTHRGALKIFLNDKLIYEYDIQTTAVKPVPLKKVWLNEKDNVLEFKTSGTGVRFWAVNKYSISDLRIIGDITDVSRQIARNIFTIDSVEMDNLLSSRLSFVPSCRPYYVGTLNIKINNELIYSAIPDCGSLNIQDIDQEILSEGKNTIFFQTRKGDYSLESVKIANKQKGVQSFIEYFEVDEDLFEDIEDDKKEVILEIDFVDNNQRKRGTVSVNGHLASFDQKAPLYKKDISRWVEEGAKNYIEIVPDNTLDIPEVRVRVD